MDLLEDSPGSNAHEFTVSEISGAVKRVIEGEFARVRVRGEIGRVSRPASGHVYFDLKDDRAVIAAVAWKGQAARMNPRPEEGMEVIATGRLTTFPGQSKYQLIVDSIEPAGAGALMAMLEKRRKMLAAEGLFDESRKRPLPYLPRVIGVITSPSGAVIRDILHRLRDRFPVRVLIWPVAVQGQESAAQVAAAIAGFNAQSGDLRPELLIVARGGGSLEDLWGFNEEIVVRAAAASEIPLISAVGHETDTTLIDFAADRRAPTPTAAAEMAVPVRAELAARLAESGARLARASANRIGLPRQRLRDLARAMGRPQTLTEPLRQRFDMLAERLTPAMRRRLSEGRNRLDTLPIRPRLLRDFNATQRTRLSERFSRLSALAERKTLQARARFDGTRLVPELLTRRTAQQRRDLKLWGDRLQPALTRRTAEMRREIDRDRARLDALIPRLSGAITRGLATRRDTLTRIDRLRQTLGYTETLKRGFVVVRGTDGVLTSAASAAKAARFALEFHDGAVEAAPLDRPPEPAPTKKKPRKSEDPQGSLF